MRNRTIGLTRVVTRATLLAACLAATGCSLLGLAPQLEEAATVEYYTGTVDRESPGKGPVIVVLHDTRAGEKAIAFYDIVPTQGVYHLMAEPGSYLVFAFEDGNGNYAFDPGERSASLRGQPGNARDSQAPAQRGRLVVRTGGPAPGYGIDLSAGGLATSFARRASRCGVVTTLDDARFAPEQVEAGVYRPMDFVRETGPGLFLLEPYDASRIPVVLVHGMDGSPRDFAVIVDHLDRSRLQPWVFYYPTGLTLSFSAFALDQFLEELQSRLGFSRLYLVAHSMGGLVSRGAINLRLGDGRRTEVERFVTISTPWLGHAAANLGVKTAPVVVPSWRDMSPGSAYLQGLFAVAWPPAIERSMLFSFHGHSMMTPGSDDGAVSVQSMLAYPAQDGTRLVRGLDEDHTSILKSPKTLELLGELLGPS
ncbi:MAG: hypothetical protein MUF10_06050 [Thermoanaerobaculaceae bacterium]|jgi:pimeloyl-ACP methyl ester carboxylesterase|nr:hypothetical protein [Thermoanaerobaculaceae bacterium]